MNEQALQDAYTLFTSKGYNGTIEEFKVLIETNDNALQDSFTLFKSKGYNQDIESYKTLIGVKKKRLSRLTWHFSRGRYGISYRNSRGRKYFFGLAYN